MPNGEGLDLTESPESSESERDTLEEEAEEARSRMSTEVRTLLHNLAADIPELVQRTEVLTFESQGLVHAQRRVMSEPLEAARRSEGQEDIARRREKTQTVLDHNGTNNGGENGGSEKAGFNAKRWLAMIGIVAVAGLGILFEEMLRKRKGQDDADVPLADDVKQQIQALVQAWAGTDDQTFWGNLAQYVQKNPCTLADIIYFMQYTQQFFPLTEPFLWNTFQDKTDIINGLAQTYAENTNSIVAVLHVLPALQYHNHPLPRTMQASCAQLAFADV